MVVAGAIAAIVVAILIAVSASSGDSAKTPSEIAGVDDATALLKGIPQDGLVIGKPDAPVTITEYLDPQCPFCAAAATGTVPQLVNRFVKTGQAKLELAPIAFIGDDSTKGALAIIAAGEQNKAGEFTEVLYRNQGAENSGWLTDGTIDAMAKALGMDVGKLNDTRTGSAAKATFDTIETAMKRDSVTSTPTFIVRGPKGQYTIKSAQNIAEFTQAVAAVR